MWIAMPTSSGMMRRRRTMLGGRSKRTTSTSGGCGGVPFVWFSIVLICMVWSVKDIAAINAPANSASLSSVTQRLNQPPKQQTATAVTEGVEEMANEQGRADRQRTAAASPTTSAHLDGVGGGDLLLSDDDGGGGGSREIRPQKWTANASPSADETAASYPSMPTDLPQGAPEWNGQEPTRRRRRKRKRRPQQQQQQQQQQPTELPPVQLAEVSVSLQAAEPTQYWRGQVEDDTEALQERDGIIVSINQPNQPAPNNAQPAAPPKPSPPGMQSWQKRPNQFQPGSAKASSHEPGRDEAPQQSQQVEPVFSVPDRSYRRPYGMGRKEEEADASGGSSALKNLLKNSGGLSLSEILQQQNLSLDDLLKGKQNAIKALQSTTAEPPNSADEREQPSSAKPLRRVPGQARPTALPGSEAIFHEPPSKPPRWRAPDFESDTKPPRRLPSFATKPKLIDVEPTVPSSPQPEITEDEVHIVGTMASFLIPHKPHTESQPDNISQPLRRLTNHGTDRVKSIREVVSGIRPDLHNSGTRKRIGHGTSSSPNTTEAVTQGSPIIRAEIREVKLPPRFGSSNRIKTVISTTTEDNNAAKSIEISTESSSTEPPNTSSSSTTTLNPIKNRLGLRPRLKSVTSTTTASTTTTTSTTAAPVDTTIPEETEETTILPEDQSDFSFSQTSQEIIESAEPEFNSIEQLPVLEEAAAESGIGSIEAIEPIEQLFGITFNEAGHPVDVGARNEDVKTPNDATAKSTTKLDVTERNPSLFLDITSSRTVDDRTDLLELLEDRRNGARLVKVLAQRNMTLSELVDHRQRGSSQLHLAEIFNNRSQSVQPEPPAPQPTHQSLDVVTAFKNFPSFNLGNVKSVVPDDIKTDSQGSSYFTSIIQIKPTDDGVKEGRALKDKYIPKPKFDSATIRSSSDFYQSWDSNSLETESISSTTTTTRRSIISFPRMAPSPLVPILVDSIDMDTNNVYKGIEQIESNSGRTQDIIDMELSGHGYKRQPVRVEQQLPVGVRSAIIASSSIVGVSLLIFIVIFATCRWRQRRKKTFNYAENFQAVRSRLPILTERESARSTSNSNSAGGSAKRSTSSPPMVFHTNASGSCVGAGGFERGGGSRSSKINTMDPNSPEVQEYLYDAMRKPFQ